MHAPNHGTSRFRSHVAAALAIFAGSVACSSDNLARAGGGDVGAAGSSTGPGSGAGSLGSGAGGTGIGMGGSTGGPEGGIVGRSCSSNADCNNDMYCCCTCVVGNDAGGVCVPYPREGGTNDECRGNVAVGVFA